MEENEVNLSFCGCGFLGIYHVGVASCFHEYAPQLSMNQISGSSAGALIAIAHICGNLQLAYATTDILRVAIDARSRALGPFHPSFDINATVREALERALPEDVHLKASGKLHVSLTRVYDGENVIINQYDSKEDVIQVLLCSCFIPFWSGMIAPKFKGISYVDGGFSNNLLILNEKTVTVSPFAGEADICPLDDTLNLLQISLSNTSFSLTPNNLYRLSHALLPPQPEILSDLFEQGFADGIRYLQRMNLISCTKCLEIRSSLLVTTNGEDMEEAFNNQVYSMKSSTNYSENVHIRLQQQEQKMIEINEKERRNSVVSTTSQIYSHRQKRIASSCGLANNSKSSHIDQLQAEDAISLIIDTDSITAAASVLGDDDVEMDDEDLDYDLRKQQLLLGCDDLAGLETDEECDECILIRQRALSGPLPKHFSDRIRDTCDTVNKSLSNWIYSHRPIKYLSYIAAPYYLPIDISIALVYKCWKTLPFLRSDMVECVYQICQFLIGILKRVNSSSSTSTLMRSATGWEADAIAYEKEMIKHRKTTTTTKTTSNQASGLNSATRTTTCLESSYQSVKITSCHGTSTPALSSSLSSLNNVCPTTGTASPLKTRNLSTTQLHSLEDTFDSIVDVTSNQEARIFAYYFRDAKNRLQVTEIFDLQRAAELCCPSCCESSCNHHENPTNSRAATCGHHSQGANVSSKHNTCTLSQSQHFNHPTHQNRNHQQQQQQQQQQ